MIVAVAAPSDPRSSPLSLHPGAGYVGSLPVPAAGRLD